MVDILLNWFKPRALQIPYDKAPPTQSLISFLDILRESVVLLIPKENKSSKTCSDHNCGNS